MPRQVFRGCSGSRQLRLIDGWQTIRQKIAKITPGRSRTGESAERFDRVPAGV